MKKGKKTKVVQSTVIKETNEDSNQIKKFLITVISIAVLASLLYYLTAKFLVKDAFQAPEEPKEVEIQYDSIRYGNITNRPESEYYVFAYDSSSLAASYYSALLNSYESEEKPKLYYMDLSLKVNEGEDNYETPTLIHVKDGKIIKTYKSITDIEKIIG